LNNGDYLAKANEKALSQKDSNALLPFIARRGLRFDLTIPFARFVVMNRNDLSFPFKRYQIQPVWRGDRPQKGRYQEFWQCDADVIGSGSLMYESELLYMLYDVFNVLGIQIRIKLNNRKILNGIAEVYQIEDQFLDMTIGIDKLDKIGVEGVINELYTKGIKRDIGIKVINLVRNTNIETLEQLLSNTEEGMKGVQEIKTIQSFLKGHPVSDNVDIDISLARGINYYTGSIIEVIADKSRYPDLVMGSLSGGGRYDNLTEVFGMKGISGVGISFGADRIYDVLEILQLYPEDITHELDIFFVTLDTTAHRHAFNIVTRLREKGIIADLYPEPVKMKKQIKYANTRKVPLVGVMGDHEVEQNVITVKDMKTGFQEEMTEASLVLKLLKDKPS